MIETKPIGEISGNPENPRTITEEKFRKLVTSLQEFPEMLNARPIVTDPNGMVLGGNMRLKAAQEAGLKTVPVYVATWDEARQKEFIIKDNVGFGEWDWDTLANEWDEVQLEEWGLDVWQPEKEQEEGLTDPDEVPEVPEEPKSKLGDLYILGDHRVLCGDSTKAEDVEKLMNGERADMVFTDPPYGIGFNYNSHIDQQGEEYLEFCRKWFNNLRKFSDFIVITTGWKYNLFWEQMEPYDIFYWYAANKTTGGRASYLRKVEPVFIYGKPDKPYKVDWIDINNGMGNDMKGKHSCPKNVALVTHFIEGHSYSTILDVFLGSGTTLIAAEKTNRKCYGMELDPKYCDVIVKRWEDFTGKKASKQ